MMVKVCNFFRFVRKSHFELCIVYSQEFYTFVRRSHFADYPQDTKYCDIKIKSCVFISLFKKYS